MGNSNSQLKRSRSQYGSTRSVAFSLPSTWDRRSYAYSEPINRTPSIASSTTRTPPKPILRNSSSASSNGTFAAYRDNPQTRNMSRSMQSLHDPSMYEQDRQFRRPSSSAASIGTPSQLTQRQYCDIYLKNDLKRHFRAQDRSAIVAQLDEGVGYNDLFDSTASLDRKLDALKSQRSRSSDNQEQPLPDENKREGATERRIRSKKKKAPLPNPVMIPAAGGNHNGMFKKKGPAPPPPIREKCRSLSSLTSITQTTSPRLAHHGSTTSLFEEIESELLTRHNIPISPTKEPQIEIPTPDYNSLTQQVATPRGIKVLPSKKPKPRAPTTPVKVVAVSQVSAEIQTSSPIQTAIPAQNEAKSNDSNTDIVVAEVYSQPTSDTVDTPHIIPIKKKKEMREIATQYNAPVEIAIQCNGHTLKQKSKSDTIRSNASSLTELVQLLNSAVQVVGEAKTTNLKSRSDMPTTAEVQTELTDNSNDTQSSCSNESSDRLRNSQSQKIVPMHEVLAGVPEPPPLPSDFHVKLLQRRTITENTPVSLAPLAPEHSISDGESMDITAESPPRDFSFFQRELMKAYERIDEKRRNNPTPTRSAENRTVKRQDSSSSSEASALKVFRHASTIMGVSTPPPQQETESDSGHDEPSDYNNSTVERAPNIPDFVFEGIAKSLSTTESEWSFDSATKSSLKNDKSKFNSIKRIKKSMKCFVSSISRNSGNKDNSLPPSNDEAEESVVSYSDENWTLSGRTRSPRASVTQPETFSPTHWKRSTAPLMDSPTRSLGSPDSTKR